MKISVENIEAYLLDYYSNQLSHSDQLAVEQFLKDNPEWDVQCEKFIYLPQEHFVFPKKQRLKKELKQNSESVEEYINDKEYLLFSLSEGQLNVEQKAKVAEWCSIDKEFELQVHFAQKSRFLPDEEILYPNKPALKRNKRLKAIYWLGAAAASVLLFVGFNHMNTSKDSTSQAKVKTPRSIITKVLEDKENRHQQRNTSLQMVQTSKHLILPTENDSSSFNQIQNERYDLERVEKNELIVVQLSYDISDPQKKPENQPMTEMANTVHKSDSVFTKSEKSDQVKLNDYSIGFRPNGKENNWTTVSKKLAELSKNQLVVNGTNRRDFSIKIGRFFFSRSKYSSKSNLSMR